VRFLDIPAMIMHIFFSAVWRGVVWKMVMELLQAPAASMFWAEHESYRLLHYVITVCQTIRCHTAESWISLMLETSNNVCRQITISVNRTRKSDTLWFSGCSYLCPPCEYRGRRGISPLVLNLGPRRHIEVSGRLHAPAVLPWEKKSLSATR
jgi:hypothetical protein